MLGRSVNYFQALKKSFITIKSSRRNETGPLGGGAKNEEEFVQVFGFVGKGEGRHIAAFFTFHWISFKESPEENLETDAFKTRVFLQRAEGVD